MQKIYSLALAILISLSAYAQNPKNPPLHAFHDNAQWHEDFAISNIEGWIMVDGDGLNSSGPFQSFPNQNTPMSFIIYNPSQTSPPNTFPEFQPRTGQRVFASISPSAGPANDWMISQELAPHPGGTFSFYAKGTFDFFGSEYFKVGYSNTGTEPSDFIFFNGGNPIQANLNWTQYQYAIPATAKHLAIVCVSYAYVFLVDDISFTHNTVATAPAAVSGFSAQMNMEQGLAVDLSWTNPAQTISNAPLTQLDGVKIYRGTHPMNYQEIATLTDVQPGQISTFSDTSVETGQFYSYRLVAFNASGSGTVYTSEFLYLEVETVPGAPHQVTFSRNENNQTVISWNEVNYGANGGALQDPVTGYTIIRKLGATSQVLANMHPDTQFTETDSPGLNLYTYQIIAKTAQEVAGAPAERHFYSGMSPQQMAVSWGTTQSDQVFELPRSSIISQSIYTAQQMGESGLITQLSYFSNIGSGQGTVNYKIYMSQTTRQVFGTTPTNVVWEFFGNQKLVYDGPVSFTAGQNAVNIPLDQPFFFDDSEGKNLIITVVKPLQENIPPVSSPKFFNTPVEGIRTYFAIGYGVDLSSITTQPANWATQEVGTIPGIVAAKATDFGSVAGNVVQAGENTGLADVQIVLMPANDETWQQETIFSNAQGDYLFPALLPGSYTLTFSKIGYNPYTLDFILEAGQQLTFDVILSDATPVTISGHVEDQQGAPIEGVWAKLSGYSASSAVTDALGAFSLNAFGGKTYELTLSHPLYISQTLGLETEEEDLVLPAVALQLDPHKPMNVVAQRVNDNALLSWDTPYGLYNKTWLQWGTHTHYTNWGWGGEAFTAGVRFTANDLQNTIPQNGHLTHVKAYIANQAQIHIEIFEGTQAASLIYTHPETITQAGWYTFELSRAIAIDPGKELWIGIRFEPGYGPYPIGIDEGPNAPQQKGSMLFSNGTWTAMSLTNKNWNIYGIVHNTFEADPLGYKVFRGIKGTDPSGWNLLTPDLLETPGFEDTTLGETSPGIYKYGVQAHYPGQLASAISPSNEVLVNVIFDIDIHLLTNGPVPSRAYISLESADHFYETSLTGSQHQTTFNDVWTGSYTLKVQAPNYLSAEISNINILQSQTLEVNLTELTPAPTQLKAQQEPGSNTALLTWSLFEAWTDDFESYPDFAKTGINNYILRDLDGLGTYTYNNFTWPGAGDPMSWMVFNPFATTPPITLNVWSGRRVLVAMAGPNGPANDWLVVPAGEGRFSFMARSLVAADPETFRVLYSTSGNQTSNFVPFDNGNNIVAPATWTKYTFEAPEGTNFVAINYIANDTYFLMVDDMEYQRRYTHALSYNIYLDGALVAENITQQQYQLEGLNQAMHLAEVEAVYASGVSFRTSIQLQGSTSVAQNEVIPAPRIFPNPSNGIFHLALPEDAIVAITDLKGSGIYESRLAAGDHTLEPGLAAGTYVVRIQTQRELFTHKLFVR